MAVDPIKYNQLSVLGSLEAGDTVLGEKVNGTTGRLTVGQLQPSDGDKGDVTVSGSGLVWTVDNDAITYDKMQNVSATDKLLGRISSGSGNIEEVTCTDLAQSLLDDATQADMRTTLGLGTLATQSGTFSGTSSGTNTGDQTSIAGISGSKAQYNTSCSDGDFLFTDGGTGTGTYDFGGASSFEIPNSAAPAVDADGEIAIDTTVSDFSHGVLKYFSGEEIGVVSMPIAQFTSPTDGHVITYDATNDEFKLAQSVAPAVLEYVSTQTVSGTPATFTNIGNWAEALFVFENLVPATGNSHIVVRTSSNNGSSYDSGASDYGWQLHGYNNSAGAIIGNDTSDIWMELTGNLTTTTNEGLNGEMRLFFPGSTSTYTRAIANLTYLNGGSLSVLQSSGFRASAAAVNAVQISFGQSTTLGNIGGGSIHLYKINRGV